MGSSQMLNALKLATPIKIQTARNNWDDHMLLPREDYDKLMNLVRGMEAIANYEMGMKTVCWPTNCYMMFARELLDGKEVTLSFTEGIQRG